MGNKSSNRNKTKGLLKVLVLGISGSGKSTFTKQMKLLHTGGFTDEELSNYREIIRLNVLTGMKELTKQTEKDDHPVSEANRKHARFFLEKQSFEGTIEWNKSILKKLEKLWKDPAIQQTWKDSSLYQLQIQNMDYLMENIQRISSAEYLPVLQDILYARQRTTGITRVNFKKDKYSWELIDVGGQIPEREKWEKVMEEGTAAVIFFAGLDEFNMISAEDKGKTKMQISMDVFSEVMNAASTEKSCMLLFLNKIDLFEKKIADRGHFAAFKKNFPDYTGGAFPEKAYEHIETQFRAVVPKERTLITHVVCAIDSSTMQALFNGVKENIFMNRMATGF